MIDIVDLKKTSYLNFYVEKGNIYCENIETKERVIVGVVYK